MSASEARGPVRRRTRRPSATEARASVHHGNMRMPRADARASPSTHVIKRVTMNMTQMLCENKCFAIHVIKRVTMYLTQMLSENECFVEADAL